MAWTLRVSLRSPCKGRRPMIRAEPRWGFSRCTLHWAGGQTEAGGKGPVLGQPSSEKPSGFFPAEGVKLSQWVCLTGKAWTLWPELRGAPSFRPNIVFPPRGCVGGSQPKPRAIWPVSTCFFLMASSIRLDHFFQFAYLRRCVAEAFFAC